MERETKQVIILCHTIPIIMDEAAVLDALAGVISKISDTPYDFALHAEHIRLAQSNDSMDDELASAIELLASFYAVDETLWLQLIHLKRKSLNPKTADGVNEIMALYERAEDDYLCTSRRTLSPTSPLSFFSYPHSQESHRIHSGAVRKLYRGRRAKGRRSWRHILRRVDA